MLNKFSNTATIEELKYHLSAEFDFEYLYYPERVINGKKENSAILITSQKQDKIQFGIWGILPHNYNDTWKQFQSNLNTLETSIDQLKTSDWLLEAFYKRRCLIMATGYFTSKIKNDKLISFYHSNTNDSVFCFAGIYNILDDGFITFSILSRHFDHDNILETTNPIVLDVEHYKDYLTDEFPLKKLIDKAYEIDGLVLNTKRISKKNIKNKIVNFDIIKTYDVEGF